MTAGVGTCKAYPGHCVRYHSQRMRAKSFHPESGESKLVPVEEAQRIIVSAVEPLEAETVPFTEAPGRVLREPVVAPHDVPFADNSAMDGYAVVASSVAHALEEAPASLKVIGDLGAGSAATGRVEAGTAIRIMTGAPIPAGADAVVPVELTDGETEVVAVYEPVAAGTNVRSRGEDIRAGSVILRPGMELGAADVGLLASVQKIGVAVGRKPVVGIIATGAEIVDVDGELELGKVINSNAYALEALVNANGAFAQRRGIIGDTLDETVAAIDAALDCDVVVTTGGVSVGAYDYVEAALAHLGAEILIRKIAMKPGKPMVFAKLREGVFFGLPGNPVSTMVTALLFVVPALRRLRGVESDVLDPVVRARLAAAVSSPPGRREYQRVVVVSRDGELVAQPKPAQGSGVLTSMAGANGLAIIEKGVSRVEAGDLIDVVLVGRI